MSTNGLSVPGGWRVWGPWAGAALGLLAVALHLGSIGHGFTFDDPHIVVENRLVAEGSSLTGVFTTHYWGGMGPAGTLYRPLTLASYWAQRRVAGIEPWSYHLANVLLHGMVTSLIFFLARRYTSDPAAVAAGLLFAVHPVHTEAVINVAGRAELMAAAGVLLAWLCRERLWMSLPLYSLGLLSKESAVALPGILLVVDLVHEGRVRLRRIAPFVAVAAAFLVLRAAVVGPGVATPWDPFTGVPAAHRVMTAIDVMGRDVALLLWPWRLSADYSFDQIPLVTSPWSGGLLAGLAAIAACGLVAWAALRRVPAVTLGILVFFAAILPVSNLIFGIGVMMAERLLYLPSAGACLAAGAALCAAGGAISRASMQSADASRRLTLATLALTLPLAAAASARTIVRIPDWRDQVTLFEATIRTSPRSALARVNLGTAYQALGILNGAEQQFRIAIGIAPHKPGTHFNLGAVLEDQGRLEEAAACFREAARLDPGDPRAAARLRRLETQPPPRVGEAR